MNTDHDAKSENGARPNPAPRKRSGRRRRTKAGDLEALRREMWHAVRKVSDALDAPDLEVSDLVKSANALAALGNAYRSVTETAELEQRVANLEQAEKQRGGRA